jgi:uncharacterized protein (TIGR02145 family)
VFFLFIIPMSCSKPKEEETNISNTVIDKDGNVYKTVTIGTQVWMAENLKTTTYKDGAAIPLVIDNTAWGNLITPAYCLYNNATTMKDTYGALYNWYTVNTGKLCPTGWHVPSDAEWTTLTTYLTNNGYGYQGNGSEIAKSMASTSGWLVLNSSAGYPGNNPPSNNSSGFSALPGGYRYSRLGPFGYIGYDGYWWSSLESSTTHAWHRSMFVDSSELYRGSNYKQYGFSIRCLKD